MRKAFTLIELLIVIFLIGLLIALVTPALMIVRRSARQATCMNHHHELMTGMAMFEQAKNRYPGWREEIGPPGKTKLVSWSFLLLPQVDRKDLYQEYGPGGPRAGQEPIEHVDLFVCPDDFGLASTAPTSLAVNCGVQDAPDTFERWDYTANGIFHDLRIPKGGQGKALTQFRKSDLADGQATIVMTDRTEVNKWTDWQVEKRLAIWWRNSLDPPAESRFNGVQPPLAESSNVNHVRPSSGHSGGAMVSFADGHSQFVGDQIDYAVYVQLMTPNGSKARLPEGGSVLPELKTATVPEGLLEQ